MMKVKIQKLRKFWACNLFILAVNTCSFFAQQNVLITDNALITTPNASSLLEMNSVNKGLLIPRVALTGSTDAVTIPSPAHSLLVYNTLPAGVAPNNVIAGYYYNSGTTLAPNWIRLFAGSAAGTEWKLLGNAGTVATTNFLGTTDAVDLVFRTNNTEKMRVMSGGNVGIGTDAPVSLFQLSGAHSTTQMRLTLPSALNGGLTGESNLQFWISEPCVTWEGAGLGVNVNNAYLGGAACAGGIPMPRITSNLGQAFIRFETNGGNMRFYTIDNSTALGGIDSRERMSILANGNIGIATTAPTQKLDIDGQIRIRQGNPGVGKVLTSDANGTATWEVPTSGGNTVGATYFNSGRQVFDASTTVSLTQEVTETTWIVPAGVTNIRVQIAGGGGGGGYGSSSATSGSCAGFVIGELAVTPGETLTIRVGRGGTGYNSGTNLGRGGAGSSILRGTVLLAAAGGGGGGSSNGNTDGFGGGGSYGTNINGANGTSTNGGTGGQNFIAYLRNSHAYAGARSVQGTTGPATGVTARFFTSLYDVSNNNRNYGYGGSFGGGTRGVVIIDF
jgi:hypothetical protein